MQELLDDELAEPVTVVVDLTAAQIADLHDNPVVIAPAPGVGYAYQVVGLIYAFHWVTTGYTSSDGRFLVGGRAQVVQDYSPWETDPPGAAPGGGAQFLAIGPGESPTGSWVVEIRQTSQGNLTPPELLDNQPLVIGNPNNNFVGGDGTIKATVRYATFAI